MENGPSIASDASTTASAVALIGFIWLASGWGTSVTGSGGRSDGGVGNMADIGLVHWLMRQCCELRNYRRARIRWDAPSADLNGLGLGFFAAVVAGHHVEAEQAAFQRAVEERRLARFLQAQQAWQAQVRRKQEHGTAGEALLERGAQ